MFFCKEKNKIFVKKMSDLFLHEVKKKKDFIKKNQICFEQIKKLFFGLYVKKNQICCWT